MHDGSCSSVRVATAFGGPTMKLTKVQDQAIQARMALIVGAETFDRLFAGIRFDETDGPLLYVYVGSEKIAAEIEDNIAGDERPPRPGPPPWNSVID